MKRIIFLVLPLLLLSMLTACEADNREQPQSSLSEASSYNTGDYPESESHLTQPLSTEFESEVMYKETESVKIQITAGGTTLTAIPEKNSSAQAFIALLKKGPITVQMSDYAGMEKVGFLGTTLPRNDTQITASPGDVILYQGNQITIYYGTNSWSLTKLAVIENATKERLLRVLGSGDTTVTFSIKK